MKKIDYSQVVTNAVSTFIAAIFIGAGTIVWNASNSIDKKINEAFSEIEKQQAKLEATQKVLIDEIIFLKKEILPHMDHTEDRINDAIQENFRKNY